MYVESMVNNMKCLQLSSKLSTPTLIEIPVVILEIKCLDRLNMTFSINFMQLTHEAWFSTM
jgi:hypothetical protein